MSISYGDAVAFINAGDIRFGVVSEIIERENKNGTSREFVIDMGGDSSPITIGSDEEIVELAPDYSILHGDKIRNLLPKCPAYKLALKTAKEIQNPTPVTDPVPPAPALTTEPGDTAAAARLTAEKLDESAPL